MNPIDDRESAPWSAEGLAREESWRNETFVESLALDLAMGHVEARVLWEEQPADQQAAVRERLLAPGFQTRVSAARDWIAATREECLAWSQAKGEAAESLAERIVAETRQEAEAQSLPAGWRGDLRLIGGFVNRRWQASWVVRLAAASLIAHLIALPAVAAYVLWVRPKVEPLVITWDLPAAEEVEEAIPGPEPMQGAEGDEDLWSALGLETDNVVARTRYTLDQPPAMPAEWRSKEVLASYWRWRIARSAQPAKQEDASQGMMSRPGAVGLGLLLQLESDLDAWALDPERGARPAARLDQALQAVWEWRAAQPAKDRALHDLALHTLRRAESLGWRIADTRWPALFGDWAMRRPALANPARRHAPLDRAWVDLVGEVLAQEAEAWQGSQARWAQRWSAEPR